LKETAKAMQITLIGELKPCLDCSTATARQKNVPKITMTKETCKGERIYLDSSSVKKISYGGNKFWILAVDAYTKISWSFFVKTKDLQVEPLMELFRLLQKNGTPLKFLRMDNAGENKLLEQAIFKDPAINAVMEYTPRDSPQYNGVSERRFQGLWQGTRSNLNGAKLPEALRAQLWCAAGSYTERVANSLVTNRKMSKGSSHLQFHDKEWPQLRHLKPFGTLGVVKTAKKIQSKLKDKGTPMLYLGPAPNHAKDVCTMYNLQTRRTVVTRDIRWMGMMYGDWKQLKDPNQETLSSVETPD
jgi:hypothetical protein